MKLRNWESELIARLCSGCSDGKWYIWRKALKWLSIYFLMMLKNLNLNLWAIESFVFTVTEILSYNFCKFFYGIKKSRSYNIVYFQILIEFFCVYWKNFLKHSFFFNSLAIQSKEINQTSESVIGWFFSFHWSKS